VLPTFVIGLREGLEAVLIVSIIATFLRRNGASLRAMWAGVLTAVALSIGVGVVLQVVDQNLPQREQEGLETVIGFVAVFFVTGMILWMRTHSRHLKRELEGAAEAALRSGATSALVLMVFLAVLREGFETSVFLLSTFQASTSPATSAGGATLGIAVAIVIGYGIYRGGVRLNLARFFKVTGVFLVFVAAGLVLTSLRTGHEAGWISVGQGTTVDLSWLAPNGAIRTALVSGVLGIPRDPRQIEVLGWVCYLVPVLALTLWPASWRMPVRIVARARWAGAAALVGAALLLFLVVPMPTTSVAATAPLDGGGTATVAVTGHHGELTTVSGGTTATWALADPEATSSSGADTSWSVRPAQADLPATLDVETLLTYTGNRVPVGLDVRRTPGPFAATWTQQGRGTVLTRDGGLVTGSGQTKLVLTLNGGGLTSPRAFTVDSAADAFAVAPAHAAEVSAQIAETTRTRSDRALWKHWFPAFLLVVAAALAVRGLRRSPEPRPTSLIAEGRTTERDRLRAPAAH
jgi:high-affinity iron transporter